MNRSDRELKKRNSFLATSRGFFSGKKSPTQEKSTQPATNTKTTLNQAQLYLNQYYDDRKSTSVTLYKNDVRHEFKKTKSGGPFIGYWPICITTSIYKDPDNFFRVLEATLNSLKPALPEPVWNSDGELVKPSAHLILGDTGSLHRHNIAKAKLMVSRSQDDQDPTIHYEAPSTHPLDTPPLEGQDYEYVSTALNFELNDITKTNAAYKPDGLRAGMDLIIQLQTDKIAKTLGIKITILPWDNVNSAEDVRAIFEPTTCGNSKTDSPNPTLDKFARLAKRYYLISTSFQRDISPTLYDQNHRDFQRFGKNFNYPISLKFTLSYLFEEMAHMMLVEFAAGHIIDAIIQPEILLKRRNHSGMRSLFHGEILNEWVVRITLDYAKSHNISPPPKPIHYITAGVYLPQNKTNSPNRANSLEIKHPVPTHPSRKSSLETQGSPDRSASGSPQLNSNLLGVMYTAFQGAGGLKACRNSSDYEFADLLLKSAVKAAMANDKAAKPHPITTRALDTRTSDSEVETSPTSPKPE
jgi:hypothetical protein